MTNPKTWRGKRTFDTIAALIFSVVSAPVALVTALWVRQDAGRPILFVQTRIGVNGRPFRMYKFRTMVNNAVAVGIAQGISDDPNGVVADDPRITRSGRFLRRTSLDELPQLLNVLKGEMSLVGPRPDIPEQVTNYSETDRERLLVRPGITGLAQVLGRDEIDWPTRVRIDRAYVRRLSPLLDLWIIFRTFKEVFRDEPDPILDEWNIAKMRDGTG